ncbi:MAG: hypothetical protein EOO05_00855 [Chitinophagaceae bacterium]|nr:MAG: hypothetical protein EOO05_00855 [Chitinophagaceae bacterium]
MKRWLLIWPMWIHVVSFAQEIPVTAERQLEQVASMDDQDLEDDLLVQQLEQYALHKLDINGEAAEILVQYGIASMQQSQNLGNYRRLFGELVHIVELQAVPGWDPAFIRRILPFIEIKERTAVVSSLSARWKGGEHSVIFRISRSLQLTDEFRKDGNGSKKYEGDPLRVFFRYRYVFRDKLQYGITGEKDAGEKFNPATGGFDFYSAHLFMRDVGRIKTLALGDFTVNMGQGLVHWQSLAFKKSADAMGIKRQSPVLRPYNSAGEFNFFRGAGIGLAFKRWQLTLFGSMRRISTNHDADPSGNGQVFTSFLRSGYNRTITELADRNNTRQLTTGMVLSYRAGSLRLAVNGIYYKYSLPQLKNDDPYNLFAIRGDRWYNGSIDLMYTWKNLHWFGEMAVDMLQHPAGMAGLVASMGRSADFSLLYRGLHKAYQSVSGNAFSENTYPGNERGLYAGLSFRPATAWKADLYFDFYYFPWLRYRVNAPSLGRDWMLQVAWSPNKQVEISSRVRKNSGERNSSSEDVVVDFPVGRSAFNWRTQINFKASKNVSLRNRTEVVISNPGSSKGFLASADLIYKTMQKPYDVNLRIQYFQTDDYESRLYAYENDVLYAQSVPVFAGSGFRYYIMLRWDLTRHLNIWLRYAATTTQVTVDPAVSSTTTVVPIKSEIKFQARLLF